ncbi:ExbD/TolR family protein [Fibrella aquatilis]|uniref:Biopolymer transporter ExbD n=1 Tax=Fibrella aquatilis TaxID=2817059 RepID=A0A939GAL8_9BACT|nr:biopolymer transporter ExbD [Fibrella aquatilis]MBO0933360.1 biopolymer transporter ExbD [Fibrella aquatilis]
MRIIWIILALLGLFVAFFVVATALSKPSTMTLNVPDTKGPKTQVDVHKTLTLYLGDKKTYLLDRVDPNTVNAAKALVAVPTDSLSGAIKRVKQQAEATLGTDSLVLIIKPLPTSSYKNMVNTLDVLAALKIKKYALVGELTEEEKALVK